MLLMLILIITPDGNMFCITDVLGNGAVKMEQYADGGTLVCKALSNLCSAPREPLGALACGFPGVRCRLRVGG